MNTATVNIRCIFPPFATIKLRHDWKRATTEAIARALRCYADELFVVVGFSDDRRLVILILFVFFVLVIIVVVGVSRWHRVAQ